MISHRRRRGCLLLIVGTLSAFLACSRRSSTDSAKPPPSRTNQSTVSMDASGKTLKIDLAKIFPPGKGRELVLGNCQNCHTFAPIVLLQMDKDAWHRNSLDHRERVTTLSDEEFTTLYEYLATNFAPDH